jgi:hypothetical protein
MRHDPGRAAGVVQTEVTLNEAGLCLDS